MYVATGEIWLEFKWTLSCNEWSHEWGFVVPH